MGLPVALALITAAASAAGQIQQSKAENRQAQFQADVAEQQAVQERKIAGQNERDYRRSQSARLAEIRAGLGGSGTSISTGTPLMALSDFAAETELNALRIRQGGEVQSSRLQQQADLYRIGGSNAQQSGYYRAGSSLLSGFAGAFK